MKTKFFKYIILLFIIVLLTACNNAYISSEYKFCMNTTNTNTHFYTNPFIVCASFYTNDSSIFSTAEIYCLKHNKKPKLLYITYFTKCSLTNPIGYIFLCE